jgi:hypothetical protein
MAACLRPSASRISGCLLAFRQQHSFALLPFRPHLFLHGVLNILRRKNIFKFDAVDLDAPFVSGLIQYGPKFGVDQVTGCQGFIQFQITDDVSQRGGGKVFNG